MNSKSSVSSPEWLQSNNLGGFASGVVSGPPERRYHALLCASLNPPTDRHLLVSHLIENIECCGEYYALSCEHYAGHRPEPQMLPLSFTPHPYPTWEYLVLGNKLVKSVLLLEHENTTLVRYKNTGAQPITIHIKPLLALRGYHQLRCQNSGVEAYLENNTVWIESSTLPSVCLSSSHGTWETKNNWYHQIYYDQEASRGFDAIDENFCPAELSVTLAPNKSLILRLSLTAAGPNEAPFLEIDKKYQSVVKKDLWSHHIESAAKQFVVNRASTDSKTILAGFPWFTDWGRDTLIALRDLQEFLSPAEARGIIQTFLAHEKDGLIPNRFPDDPRDAVEYNTIDATLWLFVAVWELHQKKPSVTFLRRIFPSLTRIIEHHIEGTHFNIQVLENGLLSGGEEGVALTWMDANVNGHVVTPRRGAAVEINMLWYNALQIYKHIGETLKQSTQDIDIWIDRFEASFATSFWSAEGKGLYDTINPGSGLDESIRPNQIYAVSLPFTVLSSARQKQVLSQVMEHLYTPLGLRSLSPADPDFRPTYEGDTWQRDTAYHQGTVWPFLLREYWVAHEKVHGKTKTRAKLKTEIERLKEHFYTDAGLGSVSEIFDGELPSTGKGCPQQAWSVAALWKMTKMLS